ncbi:MAG TPA: putative FMN-dependent luciferase-like monooxygenase, partial [Candidatus Yaniella excrementavium]|nr:putative FMN-dependent luciferase-like monooxygenase [Candidatus Yaniella excrementavium]
VVIDEEDRTAALQHLRTRVAHLAERNLRSNGEPISAADLSDGELLRYTGTYFGTADEVAEQLAGDQAAEASTEVSFQVHSLDPGHQITMRSIELLGTKVAPALGWTVEQA